MIEQFQGEHRWLSNFWYFEKPLRRQGLVYTTNEHFYQAMKSESLSVRTLISQHPSKGLKRYACQYILREDWEDIKLNVMLYGIRYKFSEHNPELRQMLIDTGDIYIQEGNNWNDTFWGVNLKTGEGENNLGKIIMKVREEIK